MNFNKIFFLFLMFYIFNNFCADFGDTKGEFKKLSENKARKQIQTKDIESGKKIENSRKCKLEKFLLIAIPAVIFLTTFSYGTANIFSTTRCGSALNDLFNNRTSSLSLGDYRDCGITIGGSVMNTALLYLLGIFSLLIPCLMHKK